MRGDCEPAQFATGDTLAQPGAPVSSVYFPDDGLIAVVSTMASGHQVELSAIGREGFIGAAIILDVDTSPYWLFVQVESSGYRMAKEPFLRHFNTFGSFRVGILRHLGHVFQDFGRSAACNRFHSHRARLARWLLVTMEKSGQRSLELTHEVIAQMVGGPRHAVTAALNELRDAGAIDYLRGRIEMVDTARLVESACECYIPPGKPPCGG